MENENNRQQAGGVGGGRSKGVRREDRYARKRSGGPRGKGRCMRARWYLQRKPRLRGDILGPVRLQRRNGRFSIRGKKSSYSTVRTERSAREIPPKYNVFCSIVPATIGSCQPPAGNFYSQCYTIRMKKLLRSYALSDPVGSGLVATVVATW